MKHQIQGKVYHTPDNNEKTANLFVIIGQYYADEILEREREPMSFRLVEESRVNPVVALLPRVKRAFAYWNGSETTGLLRLELALPKNSAEAQDDAQNGGRERTIRVQDMVRDLARDKTIAQPRPKVDVPDRGTVVPDHSPEIGQRQPPEPRVQRRGPVPEL